MFEQSSETVSPPSRGRSPAGSVTSDGARPYSKVRTSFISVDRSGETGSSSRKMSSSGDNRGSGINEPRVMAGGSNQEVLEKEEAVVKDVSPKQEAVYDSAKPDKPVAGTGEELADISPADPKDETAITGDEALKSNGPDLGSVLKGSPFATPKKQAEDAPKPTKEPTPPNPPTPPNASKTNGQPNESRVSPNKTASKSEAPKPRTSVNATKQGPISEHSNLAPQSPNTSQTDGPTDSGSSVKPARTSLERLSVQKNRPGTDANKAQRTNNTAAAPKAPGPDLTKLRQTSVRSNGITSNKPGPKSPISKPRPKSPTRPVRLPASATAPTASSAAKLGGPPPSRSPSRASIASSHKPTTLNRSRPTPLTSTVAQARQKPVRSSLPPQSTAASKSKTRTSTASAKGSDESFLARMMRPTESSKSKTHEKVEATSPPRKTLEKVEPKSPLRKGHVKTEIKNPAKKTHGKAEANRDRGSGGNEGPAKAQKTENEVEAAPTTNGDRASAPEVETQETTAPNGEASTEEIPEKGAICTAAPPVEPAL